MYYGRGAGGIPTASAVVADLVSIALGTAKRLFDSLGVWPDRREPAKQLGADAARSRYYLRITCVDQPGVLAQIASILGRRDISISSVLQHEPPGGKLAETVPVVITTDRALEGHVRKALEEVDALEVIKAETICIPIVDEHPEQL